MNEKLAKKLEKLLAKAGLDEDKIDEILSEVAEASAEEGVPNDVDPEAVPEGEGEVQGDDVPTEELPVEEVPQEEVVPQAEEEQVPPTDGSIENALNELAAQEQGGQVPPTEQAVPPVPQVDPSQIEQLVGDLGEAQKTIQGLLARIDSLEQALTQAGVISGGGSQLGDEQGAITPSANHDASADVFDDVLARLNGK